ncbi:hypothetical protein [uncultured Bacteroides sp.]|jgi:hypothetical protein|uniref:hypothetical protein n=1 Tax=uncultured Bacteroides sp. TaxID=162156 RepID=UPI00280B2D9B|nr:hypothetical protein [uncultured Bacteroides sp.]
MNLLHKIFPALLIAGTILASCNDNEEPFSVAGPDDEPHILIPTFPDRVDGILPTVATINRDANLQMTLTVTPADYCDIVWYIDGEEVAKGKDINIPLMAGTYTLKVTATTPAGKSTFREGLVQVNPLTYDPWPTVNGYHRILAPGQGARLTGDHLYLVKSLTVAGEEMTDVRFVYEGEGGYLTFNVPADLNNGEHRLVLRDEFGDTYGGGLVTVSQDAMVTSGTESLKPGNEVTFKGVNLDKVATVNFGEYTVEQFSVQSAAEITFTIPHMPNDKYELTGTTKSGDKLQFYTSSNEIVTSTFVTVTSVETLWSGHHKVTWNVDDTDPNFTFNLISKERFEHIEPGTIMTVYYSIDTTASEHRIAAATGWWNLLSNGGNYISATEDGSFSVELTQDVLDKILSEDGFLCVGLGYYVDLITLN